MIKKIIYLAFLLPLAGNAQTTVIKPLVKQPTAFAIITDNQTYANTKDAMHQYKTAVEDDGLAKSILLFIRLRRMVWIMPIVSCAYPS